jgi:DNA modification methylase
MLEIVERRVDQLLPYKNNPRKNDKAVDRMVQSIQEFGFTVPVLAKSDNTVIDGHLRLKAAVKLGIIVVPVILCDGWTDAQVKAFRLMVNRSVTWASWDPEALASEFADLRSMSYDFSLTGFDPKEINQITAVAQASENEDEIPEAPVPRTKLGDVWILGPHRLICGDSTQPETVAKLLQGAKPVLMVTDPPYGIELDSEWRDRAGLNTAPGQKRTALSKAFAKNHPTAPAEPSYMKHRIEGHTETTISGDTIADWSPAFELVPSIQVAYVWHASCFTTEVLAGLLRIGFLYPQQIIWNKGRVVLTRTHYWYQHEPCWYVRKKNAPWYGEAGKNSTVWDSASPKFIMGGSGEEKYDHPTQKPVELMRKSILNHTKEGELVYEPFGGSGTTLAACELTRRVCLCSELDPKFVDVIVARWEKLSGKQAVLEV